MLKKERQFIRNGQINIKNFSPEIIPQALGKAYFLLLINKYSLNACFQQSIDISNIFKSTYSILFKLNIIQTKKKTQFHTKANKIMSFFRFGQQGCSKVVSIILCVLMICLGAYNVAHGAIVGNVYTHAVDVNALNSTTLNTSNDILEAQLRPVSAVIIVAGSIVMFIYIALIPLMFCSSDRVKLSRIFNVALLISFGLQFAVGVASAVLVIYYKQLYKPFLQKSFVDTVKAGADGPVKTLIIELNKAVDMTVAEAILAFIIGLLCSLALMISLHHSLQSNRVKQTNANGGSAQRISY